MSLAFYKDTNSGSLVDANNYIFSAHDGKSGSWKQQLLYIRNDSASVYYDNIIISVLVEGEVPEYGVDGHDFVYQLYRGSAAPTIEEWNAVPTFNELNIGSIGELGAGDTTTYVPFYLRVYVPGSTSIGLYTNVDLNIRAIEYAA